MAKKAEIFDVECGESGEEAELTLKQIPAFIRKNRVGNTEWRIYTNCRLNEGDE